VLHQAKRKSVLDNAFIAFVIAFAALNIVGNMWRDLWAYLFSAAVVWVISDVIINLIVRGGGGLAQIPLWGNKIQTKGRSFLAFVFGVFFTTWASSFLSEALYKGMGFGTATVETTLNASQANWMGILISSLMVGVLIFLDFNARFYGREKRKS
jgi:hypothetical protein